MRVSFLESNFEKLPMLPFFENLPALPYLFRKSPRPSLPLKRAPPLTPTLSPSGEREETALLGARNRYALRLAGHQSPRQIVRDGTAWVLLACDLLMDLLLLACGLLIMLAIDWVLLVCGLLMGLLMGLVLLACGLLMDLLLYKYW